MGTMGPGQHSEIEDGKVNDVERSTSVNQALADVLMAIDTASRTLALQRVAGLACGGDRQRLAACLGTMTPDQLTEVAAAARLLSAEAEQALARQGPVTIVRPTPND
jgi:hypothetical protein